MYVWNVRTMLLFAFARNIKKENQQKQENIKTQKQATKKKKGKTTNLRVVLRYKT